MLQVHFTSSYKCMVPTVSGWTAISNGNIGIVFYNIGRVYIFFANYTIHRRHLQRTHTHPYEYTHANPTLGASSKTVPANPQD
jgi:hypothetical protein